MVEEAQEVSSAALALAAGAGGDSRAVCGRHSPGYLRPALEAGCDSDCATRFCMRSPRCTRHATTPLGPSCAMRRGLCQHAGVAARPVRRLRAAGREAVERARAALVAAPAFRMLRGIRLPIFVLARLRQQRRARHQRAHITGTNLEHLRLAKPSDCARPRAGATGRGAAPHVSGAERRVAARHEQAVQWQRWRADPDPGCSITPRPSSDCCTWCATARCRSTAAAAWSLFALLRWINSLSGRSESSSAEASRGQ